MKKSIFTKVLLLLLVAVLALGALAACKKKEKDNGGGEVEPDPGYDWDVFYGQFQDNLKNLTNELDAIAGEGTTSVNLELDLGLDLTVDGERTVAGFRVKANLHKTDADKNEILFELYDIDGVVLGIYTYKQDVWFTEKITTTTAQTWKVNGVKKYEVGKLLGGLVMDLLGSEAAGSVSIGSTVDGLLGEKGMIGSILGMIGGAAFFVDISGGDENLGAGTYALKLKTAELAGVIPVIANGVPLLDMIMGLLVGTPEEPGMLTEEDALTLLNNPMINDVVKILLGVGLMGDGGLLGNFAVPETFPMVALTIGFDAGATAADTDDLVCSFGIHYKNSEFSFMSDETQDVELKAGIQNIKVSRTLATAGSIVPAAVRDTTQTPVVKVTLAEFKVAGAVDITAELYIDPSVGIDGLKATVTAKKGSTVVPLGAELGFDENKAPVVYFDIAYVYTVLNETFPEVGLTVPAHGTIYKVEIPLDLYSAIGTVDEKADTTTPPAGLENNEAAAPGGGMGDIFGMIGNIGGLLEGLTGMLTETGILIDVKALSPTIDSIWNVVGGLLGDLVSIELAADETLIDYACKELDKLLSFEELKDYLGKATGLSTDVKTMIASLTSYKDLFEGKGDLKGVVIALDFVAATDTTSGVGIKLSIATNGKTLVSAALKLAIVSSTSYPTTTAFTDAKKAAAVPTFAEEGEPYAGAFEAAFQDIADKFNALFPPPASGAEAA